MAENRRERTEVINPYAPPGASGGGGSDGGEDAGGKLPPRPAWETVVIFLCFLGLTPFFMPVAMVTEELRFAVGAVTVVLLVWIAWRRLRALRGTIATEAPPKRGQPKPFHVERKFDGRKR